MRVVEAGECVRSPTWETFSKVLCAPGKVVSEGIMAEFEISLSLPPLDTDIDDNDDD